jgi:hypothetical protein
MGGGCGAAGANGIASIQLAEVLEGYRRWGKNFRRYFSIWCDPIQPRQDRGDMPTRHIIEELIDERAEQLKRIPCPWIILRRVVDPVLGYELAVERADRRFFVRSRHQDRPD